MHCYCEVITLVVMCKAQESTRSNLTSFLISNLEFFELKSSIGVKSLSRMSNLFVLSDKRKKEKTRLHPCQSLPSVCKQTNKYESNSDI